MSPEAVNGIASLGTSQTAIRAEKPETEPSRKADGVQFQQALRNSLQPGAPAEPETYTHTVKSGENLSLIVSRVLKRQSAAHSSADNMNEAVSRIARHNNLRNPNLIYPGQRLDLSPLFSAKSAQSQGQPKNIPAGAALGPASTMAPASYPVTRAAVALANSRLYESVQALFEGFVSAAVTAIESRDPTTSGHSFRVAELTVGLAEAVNRTPTGPYAGRRFSADELRELRYAALLHDFGKVGVREHVLLKAKKLYPAELERIRHRVTLLKREVELRAARQKLGDVLARGRRGFARRAALVDAEAAARLAELDQALARVLAANEPSVLPREVLAELQDLARPRFEDASGRRHAVLTAEEAEILAIPRGSLTAAEMEEMRSHVVHTREFLSRIPWTRELRRVPQIAGAHHERLDGSGYPRGLRAPDIPIQARMMTIADIYDALTAADRPYKKAVPVEHALDILQAERRAGAVDGDLLDLFIAARVFERGRR